MLLHKSDAQLVAGASCHRKLQRMRSTSTPNPTAAHLYAMIPVLIAFLFLTPSVATGADRSISTHGVTATILPDNARPGDIVELRIEMNRETWGRFILKKLNHPQLRTIAEEKIPVSYQGQLYKQRHSLFLQPVSSGEIKIGTTTVTISTATGEETVELPALDLSVRPFDSPALSDLPLPLPPDEAVAQSGSMFSLLFWMSVAFAVLGIWSLVFFGMRNRELQPVRSDSSKEFSHVGGLIQRLRSGVVGKDDLENLLHDSNLSISAELRSKMEQAVYSEQFEPADLATLLQEELIA